MAVHSVNDGPVTIPLDTEGMSFDREKYRAARPFSKQSNVSASASPSPSIASASPSASDCSSSSVSVSHMPRRGALILIEGLDRSGKSTQCKLLVETLNKQRQTSTDTHTHIPTHTDRPAAVLIRFPDRTTVIGQMIDSYLTGGQQMDDRAIHLLFSANRWEARNTILDALNAGTHVVLDRYSFSGAAFTAAKGLSLEWCFSSEVGLPRPDLVLFLSISASDAESRGGYGQERYENKEIQQKVAKQFELLREQEAAGGHVWQVVEAGWNRTIEEVSAEIQQLADQVIEQVISHPTDIDVFE